MKTDSEKNEKYIRGLCLGLVFVLMAAAVAALPFSGGIRQMFRGWWQILIAPCPLITDYFRIGGISATFFNAAICSFTCLFIAFISGAKLKVSFLSAYLLVVAHCFYGMNFFNIWPCYIGVLFYYVRKKMDFRDHLHIAMFSMAFGPLVSEMLFRYPLGDSFVPGTAVITLPGVLLMVFIAMAAGMALPGMLEGALWMHKGYNLYNGGLAFGLVGYFLYDLLYKTMGIKSRGIIEANNMFYDGAGISDWAFSNVVFVIIFGTSLAAGYLLNGKSMKGYGALLEDTGHRSVFAEQYGMPVCLINFGIYGFMVLGYMNLVMILTEGVAFTGPTVGAIFAAVTFAAVGQHPKNTWSIFAGYVVLSLFVTFVCMFQGREVPWTLSTQGYINGVAFATGLAPLHGRYGWRSGLAAGIISAAICTSTAAFHGGFMLFNGGFSAGITALILVPILEHHYPHMRVKN